MKEKISQTLKQVSLSLHQSEIQAIRKKNITKTGYRVIRDGKIGIAGAIGQADEAAMFEQAEKNLAYGIDYDVIPSENLVSKTVIEDCDVTAASMVKGVKYVLKELKSMHPDFSVSHKVNLSTVELSLQNDRGLDLLHRDKTLQVGFLLRQQGSSDILNTAFSVVSRQFEPERVLEASSGMIKAYIETASMPKDPYIIMDGRSLTDIFARHLNGSNMGTGASLFNGKIGYKLFSEDFSLSIDRDPYENFTCLFDSEGVMVDEDTAVLIKNGAIQRPYTDKRTAKKYNFMPTGSAGGSYDSVPSLSAPSMLPSVSDKTLKELLDGRYGILVVMASGGDFTPDGIFASPVQLSYLTDGERLLGRLPEFTLKASIYDIFGKDYRGFSKDKFYMMGNEHMIVTKMDIELL
ncbi:MAG: hypothetical protein GX221_07205 [Candidatus Riflebacteria bacterium]|nr:hypothetical protein [Candidatus Riflebacteria bacterium]